MGRISDFVDRLDAITESAAYQEVVSGYETYMGLSQAEADQAAAEATANAIIESAAIQAEAQRMLVYGGLAGLGVLAVALIWKRG